MAWSINYVLTEFNPTVVQQLCLNDSVAGNLYLVKGEIDLLFVTDADKFWDQVKSSAEVELDIDELKPPAEMAPEVFDSRLKIPPRAFPSYLKGLAQSTSLPVCFYCHETWAGTPEYENAWVFTEDKEFLFIVDSASESNPIYRNENGVWVQVDTDKTVLQLMLECLGIESPDKHFPPHARDFDWASHKVKCSSIVESI